MMASSAADESAAETGEPGKTIGADRMGYCWPQDFDRMMRNFFEPKSITIVGATEGPGYGSRMVDNLLEGGYKGKILPVNPNRSEVRGIPCFSSVLDIDTPVDLAAIVIPAPAVMQAVEQCTRKGIRSILIISAGFLERDGQVGARRQRDLQQFAIENGLYICGPNCLGIANLKENVQINSTPGITNDLPKFGPIGVVSQSGATAFGPLLCKARDRAAGLKYIVSTGNEAGLEATDFIRFMLDDPEIRVIIAFIEGFKNGDKLKAVAELALERQKPIVVMKMGRSEAGGRAALTHTASIAGSFQVYDGFFRQKGFIRVDDYDELCEVAKAFAKGRFPKGNRIGIISHSGGICTFLTDACDSAGFEVPSLSMNTTTRIDEILKGFGACQNPLDLTGAMRGPHFPEILDRVLNDPNVDSTILMTRGDRNFAEKVIAADKATEKPFFFTWTHSEFDVNGLPALRNSDIPTFISPVKCVTALKHLLNYRKKLLGAQAAGASPFSDDSLDKIRSELDKRRGSALPEGESRKILSILGLPFCPSALCLSVDEASEYAARFEYPVVLKIDSPQVLHKTECNGVILDIRCEADLQTSYEALTAASRTFETPVKLTGIMVQKMVLGGIELLLGTTHDPVLGATVMLGWGGIYVEAMGMIAIRVCPITPNDADGMIQEIPGLVKILDGIRGKGPLDRQALVELMVRVSHLAHALEDRVASMDFNPIRVLPQGEGVMLLDCRIVTGASETVPS
ncbi:MAG: acetate--CoA ligase family protein [Candidatus Latescibacterota bacterium]